jgi:hypothetical protein
MKSYIGTKRILAKPMNRAEYHEYMRVSTPCKDYCSGYAEGYLVEYIDDGGSNHPNHKGYISWSLKDVFEGAYRLTDGLNFGMAIEAAKMGNAIARKGWNGKGMFVVFMSGMSLPSYNTQDTKRKVNDRTARFIGCDTPLVSLPYFAMFTADKKWQPGWLASQSDILADDWYVVKLEKWDEE